MRLIAKAIRISHAKFHCNRLTTLQDIQDYASLIFATYIVPMSTIFGRRSLTYRQNDRTNDHITPPALTEQQAVQSKTAVSQQSLDGFLDQNLTASPRTIAPTYTESFTTVTATFTAILITNLVTNKQIYDDATQDSTSPALALAR